MKKRQMSVILAAVLTLSLAACGSGGQNTPAEAPAEEAPAVEAEEEAAAEETAVTAAVEETAAEAATASAQAEDVTMIENGGMKLAVPNEYADLLIIDMPKDDPDGILFKVTEKASVEAAAKQGDDADGPGWLFSIGPVSEESAKEQFCEDMSGREIFAKAQDGSYFEMYHPTDVRLVREQYDDIEKDMEQWGMLNDWAAGVGERFVADNEGLTFEKHSNTNLDIYFARIAYKNDLNYTISSLEAGTNEPGDFDASPYLSRLMNGVTYQYADVEEGEEPDGEYVVFAVPEDGVRFDFFFMDGKQNYIRQVTESEGETYEVFYEAVFEDETETANGIMNEWCNALAGNTGDN